MLNVKQVLKLSVLTSLVSLVSCVDANFLKQAGAGAINSGGTNNLDRDNVKDDQKKDDTVKEDDNTADYKYTGSCTKKFTLTKSSSLTPELKKGDSVCLEYSPKSYQGSGATGATIIIASATWCGPCKQFKEQFSQLQDLAERHKATIKIFLEPNESDSTVTNYTNVSEIFMSKDQTPIMQVFQLRSYPSIVVLDNKGAVAGKPVHSLGAIEQVLEGL